MTNYDSNQISLYNVDTHNFYGRILYISIYVYFYNYDYNVDVYIC